MVTGLRNDSIKGEIKQLMKTPDISDEDLLEALNKAVSDENERQVKIKKNVSCNIIEETAKPEKKNKENPLLTEIRELKVQLNEVTSMKTEVEQLNKWINKENKSNEEQSKSRFRRRRPGCPACVRDSVEKCQHCFKCGSSEHFKAGCKKPGN